MKRSISLLALLAFLFGGWLLLRQYGAEGWGGGEDALVELGSEPDARDGAGGDEGREDSERPGPVEGGRSALDSGVEGEIRGRVLDLLSGPLQGARILLHRTGAVRLRGEGAPVLARAVSDERGFFRMQGLDLGSFSLRVRAEGRAERLVEVRLDPSKPRIHALVLRMSESYALRGVVVDPDGKAIAGAWVVANWGDASWEETRSDAEGGFTFASLPPEMIEVLAWSEGRMLGLASWDPSWVDPLRFELKSVGPCKLLFSLAEPVEEGRSKPGDVSVEIRLSSGTGRKLKLPVPIRVLAVPPEREVSSRGLREGTYHLLWHSKEMAKEMAMEQVRTLAYVDEEDPEYKVELSWESRIGIQGRLVYEGGKPAKGILLRAEWKYGPEPHFAKSDADGSFVFPGRYLPRPLPRITLSSPGIRFAKGIYKTPSSRDSPAGKENLWTVVRTHVFAGRVIDGKGRPVSGARLWLRPSDEIWKCYGKAVSDEQGEFRIWQTHASERTLFLDATHFSLVLPRLLPLRNTAQHSQQALLLRMVDGAQIEGRVVDERGAGIPGAEVNAHFQGRTLDKGVEDRARRRKDASSNREGQFRVMGLTPGSWRLFASSEGRFQVGASPLVQLGPGEKRGELRLVFSKGLSIEGRIVGDQARPLAGARITAEYNGKLAQGAEGDWGSCESDPDGRFVITGLRPGGFKLTAALSDEMEEELGVSAASPDNRWEMEPELPFETSVQAGIKNLRWQVTLPRWGGIRVRLAHGQRSLQRIQMELSSGWGDWTFAPRVVQGVVSLNRVWAGTYDIRFKSPWFKDLETKVQVHGDQVSDLGLLTLVQAEHVDGRVVDPDGQALAGVWIGVDPRIWESWTTSDLARGPEQFGTSILAKSDAEGRFSVPVKGAVMLQAFKRGYVPGALTYAPREAEKGTRLGAGTTQAGAPRKQVVLVLQPAGQLQVQAPVPGEGQKGSSWLLKLRRVAVSLGSSKKSVSQPWMSQVRLRAGKTTQFIGLRPGPYQLFAVSPAKNTLLRKQTIPGASYYEEILIKAGTNPLILIR